MQNKSAIKDQNLIYYGFVLNSAYLIYLSGVKMDDLSGRC